MVNNEVTSNVMIKLQELQEQVLELEFRLNSIDIQDKHYKNSYPNSIDF
jgi:conjugal transfer/entry exclusion protein